MTFYILTIFLMLLHTAMIKTTFISVFFSYLKVVVLKDTQQFLGIYSSIHFSLQQKLSLQTAKAANQRLLTTREGSVTRNNPCLTSAFLYFKLQSLVFMNIFPNRAPLPPRPQSRHIRWLVTPLLYTFKIVDIYLHGLTSIRVCFLQDKLTKMHLLEINQIKINATHIEA